METVEKLRAHKKQTTAKIRIPPFAYTESLFFIILTLFGMFFWNVCNKKSTDFLSMLFSSRRDRI